MLPKQYRLLLRKDFLLSYVDGKKYTTRKYILFVRKTDLSGWRLGITVTKKNGNAVNRNKFKRVVRALFEKYIESVHNGYDYVILFRGSLEYKLLSLASVEQELLPLLRKIGKIKTE